MFIRTTGMRFDFSSDSTYRPPCSRFTHVQSAYRPRFHFRNTYIPCLLTRRIVKKVLKSFADLYRCQHITLLPKINLPGKHSRATQEIYGETLSALIFRSIVLSTNVFLQIYLYTKDCDRRETIEYFINLQKWGHSSKKFYLEKHNFSIKAYNTVEFSIRIL